MLEEILIQTFHNVNRFLGSAQGELFKDSFEVVLFTFTTYMIISEYWRDPQNKSMRELALGFGMLSISKGIATAILGMHTFSGLVFTTFLGHIYMIEVMVEIFAIWVLIRYFLQPILEKKNPKLLQVLTSTNMIAALTALIILSAAAQISTGDFDDFYDVKTSTHFAVLNLVRAGVLMLAIYLCLRYYSDMQKVDKYHRALMHAFMLYSITPIIGFINFLYFGGANPALIILAHPFPFIAVAQFTRVIFLRTADKASILDKLNITEQKYLKSQEVCALKDEFVGIVSHELKTPLTTINLYAAMLEKGTLGDSTPKQQEAYRTIKEECERLSNLIQDILDMNKLESKKMKLRREKIDLHALVEASKLTQMAERKRITIDNMVPVGTIINVDPDKMKQVLINLESNAIKYSDEGSSIKIGHAALKKGWELYIEDTGWGIPKEKLPKLFDKFYQVEDHMTRKIGGTGLGLTIVKQIIELHGGKIKATSEVGKGSRFTIIMGR